MSSGEIIGKVSPKGDQNIEWTIGNFFSYTTKDVSYESPRFEISGTRWYLQVCPNGGTKSNTVGWIALYLFREADDSSPSQGVNFNIGLKRPELMKEDFTWVFDETREGFGWPKFYKRSKLKSELAPSNTVTVTCFLRVNKGLHCSSSTDTLSRDLLDIFNSKRGCDATLKVKQQEFPVHKIVLSARSPVFVAVSETNMKEKQTGVVDIQDCDLEYFKKFLYSGKAENQVKQEEFPVHKCILAARSPVFAAMFEVDMKEKQTGVVDIVDCDPEAFKEFLKYLYSGTDEDLSIGNAFELYRIADKYGVGGLKPACLISIMLNLSVENVCDAVLLGHQYSLSEIKVKSNSFFNENFGEIVSTAQWKSFLKSNCDLANELLIDMASKMKSKK